MTAYKVGYLIGSLATKSINRLLAQALVKLAPPELQMMEISFKDLPLYSYDYDENYPPVAIQFKNSMRRSMPCYSSRPSTTARFQAAARTQMKADGFRVDRRPSQRLVPLPEEGSMRRTFVTRKPAGDRRMSPA